MSLSYEIQRTVFAVTLRMSGMSRQRRQHETKS